MSISFHFPTPEKLQAGDTVRITLQNSVFYGQTGMLVEEGKRGGWYVKFDGQKEPVYIPFGYEKVEKPV